RRPSRGAAVPDRARRVAARARQEPLPPHCAAAATPRCGRIADEPGRDCLVLEGRALLFDVFGPCVDWRSGVMRDVTEIATRRGRSVDAGAFADGWRSRYQPSMEEVRSGRRPFTLLDVLHRESLDAIAAEHGLETLDESDRRELVLAWHRLDP